MGCMTGMPKEGREQLLGHRGVDRPNIPMDVSSTKIGMAWLVVYICNPSCSGYLDHSILNLGKLANLSEIKPNTTQNYGARGEREEACKPYLRMLYIWLGIESCRWQQGEDILKRVLALR